jgi:predicted nucleic acid-binding protein
MLERAAAAKSDCIVTEDQDLLRIGQFGNARMVTIAEFLTLAPTREKKSRS